MIEEISSIQFKDQINTFNRPIVALCRTVDGLETYFLKYLRTGGDLAGLFSEIVCSRLARKIDLNTPEIALVKIGDHPIDTNRIKFHYKIKPGLTVFGSKRQKHVKEISQHNFIVSKHDFNQLEYPPHILRIAMFDLWVGNKDRRADNFNLFLSQARKQKLCVFDHFEAFEKITETNKRNIPLNTDAYNGILGTAYGYEMLQWVKRSELKHELKKFRSFLETFDVNRFINSVLTELPQEWKLSEETIYYVKRFLTSDKRINLINKEISNYLEHLPSKS